MSKTLSSLSFLYDRLTGFGDLVLSSGAQIKDRLRCRTGSIQGGRLINAMPIGNYAIQNLTVSTTEEGMWLDSPKNGWKAILFLVDEKGKMQPTHLRIHPDGGLGGTLGCIGIQGSNALSFRAEIDAAVNGQGIVLLTVGTKLVGAA